MTENIDKQMRVDTFQINPSEKLIAINSGLLVNYHNVSNNSLQEEAKDIATTKKNLREERFNSKLNTIRWRFNEDKEAETNSRLVEWSDGTYGIYVGDQYYDVKPEAFESMS